ncbi:MAG: hypothetical protein R2729_27350 [Bryobacteraceae bacterium]
MPTLTALLTLTAALVLLALFVVRRTLHLFRKPAQIDRALDFSPMDYHPFARILDSEDVLFLRAQPGYTVSLERRLVRQRRRVAQLYLRQLGDDFRSLHAAARALALHDRMAGDAGWLLVRQSVSFWSMYHAVRLRLALMPLSGLQPDLVHRFKAIIDVATWMRGQIDRPAISVA